MKKLYKVLIICLFLVPVLVKADMGAPVLREFEATVVSENGLTVKDYNNKTVKFKKGDTITVTGSGEEYKVVYKNNYYNIKSEDIVAIKPVTSSVNPNDKNIYKLEKTREFEVLVDKLEVYSGPANVYDEVGHLSKGEQVTAFYATESESYSDYFYIQEEELKGWIYIGQGGIKSPYNVREVNATTIKVIMVKDITLNNTTVKDNTISSVYYWANPWTTTVPVIKVNNEMVVLNDEATYELINEGKKPATNFRNKQFNVKFNKETKIYATMNGSEVLETIPADTELSTINLVYDGVADKLLNDTDVINVLVFYNNKLGWVKATVKTADFTEAEELVAPYTDIEGDDDTEPTTEAKVEEPTKKSKVSTKEVVIYSVIGAVAVAVMAMSSIVMLNKSNKKSTLKEIEDELEKTQSIKVVKDKKEDK